MPSRDGKADTLGPCVVRRWLSAPCSSLKPQAAPRTLHQNPRTPEERPTTPKPYRPDRRGGILAARGSRPVARRPRPRSARPRAPSRRQATRVAMPALRWSSSAAVSTIYAASRTRGTTRMSARITARSSSPQRGTSVHRAVPASRLRPMPMRVPTLLRSDPVSARTPPFMGGATGWDRRAARWATHGEEALAPAAPTRGPRARTRRG